MIRWLISRHIKDARIEGYLDGFSGAADAIRRIAARQSPERARERDALNQVAAGFEDAVKENRP